ncbi:MAG: zf-HC2 domain-containing protein [Candidatus Binatia bacterium]
MNACERIEESMGRWLDGELSAAESEVVRAHVSGCANCGAARQRFEKIERVMGSVLVAAAPRIEFTPFWRELERRIDEKRPWRKGARERIHGWFAAPRAAWAIPALIVVLLAVLSYDSYFPFGRSRNNLATVESIDAHGRSVALLREDESKTTVIWLYQNQEGDDEAAEETPQPGPAF